MNADDDTDRERVVDALRESEERFRNLADNVPVLIWVADQDRKRNYFNKTWQEFTGRALHEELGDGWVANVHPDDMDRHLSIYAAAFTSRQPFEIEYRLRRQDGEYRWMLARGAPRFTPNGAFAGFCGLCLDVTDRKRSEENLRLSEARYRTLTESLAASERLYRAIGERFRTLTEMIPQMVWTANPRGEMTFINQRWATYTGRPFDLESPSEEWLEAVHPEDVDAFRSNWRQAFAQDAREFSAELRVRRASDGCHRWMHASAVSVRDSSGATTEWVGSFTDIDDQKRQTETLDHLIEERTKELLEEVEERRRVELQLRTVAAELGRSNAELEQFAYVASHDLQEPLRKIQAFGDRLRSKFSNVLPEAAGEYVERMHASAARMRRLIDDLLSFSRVTTQARPFVRVELEKIAHEVVSDLEEYINQNEAAVEIGPLPAIDADPTQMRQLFQNLIANAIKFHRPNIKPVVKVHAMTLEDSPPASDSVSVPSVWLLVEDNGIGFDEKYLDRIFQVFQRLHGRDEYEGTGVGLAICRKIAERHGGAITAQSKVGAGATFVITLPIHQTSNEALANVRPDQEIHHHSDGG